MTVILALGTLMLEDGNFEANLCYIVRSSLQNNKKAKQRSHYTQTTEVSLNSLQNKLPKDCYESIMNSNKK